MKSPKILLVFPPVTRPEDFSAQTVRVSPFLPLGLAYLAAVLIRDRVADVAVLDALVEGKFEQPIEQDGLLRYGLTDREIETRMRREKPDVVGISCLFAAQEWDALNLCRLAKRVNKDMKTVLGGVHPGTCARTLLEKCPEIDYIVIGEGEMTFRELVENLASPEHVPGVAFLKEGHFRFTPRARFIEDLDSLPFPARHLFPVRKYLDLSVPHSGYRNIPFTQMITSRGCAARCTFCALGNHWGTRQRKRSAAEVLNEIEDLIGGYGIREIHFEDDNLTADRRRAVELFEGIKQRFPGLTWTVPTGMAVFSLDEELLEIMKDSGCYSVSLAIESGSQWVLRELMRKPVDLDKVPVLVRKLRALGIESRGFFILGYPGETGKTMRQTIDYARSLELDWAHFFIAAPLPGTEMYQTCLDRGYMKEADFDSMRSFHRAVISTPEFTPQEVEALKEEAIIDVNFRHNVNLRKYDPARAARSFEQVLQHYPHFDFATFALGEAHEKMGNIEKSMEFYRKTLELKPDHEGAREKLKHHTV